MSSEKLAAFNNISEFYKLSGTKGANDISGKQLFLNVI